MRSALAAAAIVLAAAAARAGDGWEPGAVRRQVEAAVRADDTAKALAILDGLLAETMPRIRERNLEAARAAWELLPRAQGAPRSAQLVAEALRMDPHDTDGAWKFAQEVRKDLVRRVDVESGSRFLAKLIEIYPNVALYRHDLALLSLDGGRRAEAREQLRKAMEMSPSDPWPAYTLALLLEEDEDTAGAVAVYDRIGEARPGELRAHLLKAKLLAGKDPAAARRAIDAGVRAAEASPTASERADYLESFTWERRRLDAADQRRATIAGMQRRIEWTIGLAGAAWALLAGVGWRLTRMRAAGRAPAGESSEPRST